MENRKSLSQNYANLSTHEPKNADQLVGCKEMSKSNFVRLAEHRRLTSRHCCSYFFNFKLFRMLKSQLSGLKKKNVQPLRSSACERLKKYFWIASQDRKSQSGISTLFGGRNIFYIKVKFSPQLGKRYRRGEISASACPVVVLIAKQYRSHRCDMSTPFVYVSYIMKLPC